MEINLLRDRVAEKLSLASVDGTELRFLLPEDREVLFDWNQSPKIRQYMRNPSPPTWEEHCRWFDSKLSAPASVQMMIIKGNPVGTLRLDEGKPVEVGIIVAPDMHGQGVCKSALRCVQMLLPELRAEIDPENISSVKAFKAAGFVCTTGREYIWRA